MNSNPLTKVTLNEAHSNEGIEISESSLFEKIFECAPEGIVILDEANKLVRCNSEFTSIFGYSSSEAKGTIIKDLIVADEHSNDWNEVVKTVNAKKRVIHETIRKRKDGTLLNVSILAIKIEEQGHHIATIGIYRDITDKKKLERQLAKQWKTIESNNKYLNKLNNELLIAKNTATRSCQAKFLLIKNLNHKIRTPLNGIIGFTQLLANKKVADDEFMDYLKIIECCSNDLLELFNKSIGLTEKKDSAECEKNVPVKVQELLYQIYLSHTLNTYVKNITLEFDCQNNEPFLRNCHQDETVIKTGVSYLFETLIMNSSSGIIKFGYQTHNNKIFAFFKASNIFTPSAEVNTLNIIFQQRDFNFSPTENGFSNRLMLFYQFVLQWGGSVGIESAEGIGTTILFTI
jgi:PAS domain S-box-containing protein